MADSLADRCREQATFLGGTGAVTLPVVAVSGSQTFLAGWGASGTGKYEINLGGQWEVGRGTLNAGGTTLTRTTVYNGSSGIGVAVNFLAGVLDCIGTMPAYDLKSLPSFAGDFALINGRINCTVAASALTIALKTSANTDPTAADPVFVAFRNATIATGDYTVLAVTTATSLVISSGSTLGATNNIPFSLHLVGFNDAGTFRLGVINNTIGFVLDESSVQVSTAEGGAGAADSLNIFYTGTAIGVGRAFRVLARLDWSAGLGTVGTWSAAPTTVQLFGGAMAVPRTPLTLAITATGAFVKANYLGLTAIIVEGVGGGASGGGANSSASQVAQGGAAGAGGYFRKRIAASALAASETVTIGAAGAAPAAGNNAGNAGGTTSFGAHASATGGSAGSAGSSGAVVNVSGSVGGVGSGDDVSASGGSGQLAWGSFTLGLNQSANGGDSAWGGGGRGTAAANGNGNVATGFGAGGSGATSYNAGGAFAGGAGTIGKVLVTLFFD